LVPFDCSQRAECALPTAVALAQANNALLLLTSVIQKPVLPVPDVHAEELSELANRFVELSREVVNTRLVELRSHLAVNSQIRVIESASITQTLLDLVELEDIDLVVFCAHGQSGQVAWPYGSVVSTYIDYGNQPVLVIQDMPPELAHPTQAEIAAEKYGSR
ncbi:MAG TPA: universal stress protein, partial [Anaerolineaceae bacterium]|nr:universal stress protein [Anaerolineaceae bacterium]